MEDLHDILEELALGKKATLIRPDALKQRWEVSGYGIIYIEPNDGEDDHAQRRDISIEWECSDLSPGSDACINLPDYPMPPVYFTEDQMRAWLGTLAKHIRLSLNAYGRKPVIFDEASVERTAYDAALAAASALSAKVATGNPEYAAQNTEWRITFPTPWADGKIYNNQVELSFENEFSEKPLLCRASVVMANPPIFEVSRFTLHRNSSEAEDPIARLAAHNGLASLSVFCHGKDVASGKSSD